MGGGKKVDALSSDGDGDSDELETTLGEDAIGAIAIKRVEPSTARQDILVPVSNPTDRSEHSSDSSSDMFVSHAQRPDFSLHDKGSSPERNSKSENQSNDIKSKAAETINISSDGSEHHVHRPAQKRSTGRRKRGAAQALLIDTDSNDSDSQAKNKTAKSSQCVDDEGFEILDANIATKSQKSQPRHSKDSNDNGFEIVHSTILKASEQNASKRTKSKGSGTGTSRRPAIVVGDYDASDSDKHPPAPNPKQKPQLQTAPIIIDIDDANIPEDVKGMLCKATETRERLDALLQQAQKEADEATNLEVSQDEPDEDAVLVQIKARFPDQSILKFKMKMVDKFDKMIKAIVERKALADPSHVSIHFDGASLGPQSSPEDHDMEDGDLVDVKIKK